MFEYCMLGPICWDLAPEIGDVASGQVSHYCSLLLIILLDIFRHSGHYRDS